jgi:hypothetical protein
MTVPLAVPPRIARKPPLLSVALRPTTVVATAVPPEETASVPNSVTVAPLAVLPDETSSEPRHYSP